MKKPLFSALYILSLLTAGLTIHQAFAQRSPSVEPITEVSIEENRPVVKEGQAEHGFDFTDKTTRVPANIATKSSKSNSPYSYIGPMLFLLALPIALWIAISRKVKNTEAPEKLAFYPKTFQFKSFKNDYHEQDVDEEDHNLPKAS